jgi:hypothetical protein
MAGRVDEACERSQARGREMLQRTAKSCGPDAPTLASSFAEEKSAQPGADIPYSRATVANKPGHRGARHKPLKPLRAGMPGDSGVLVYSCAYYHYKAHTRPRVQRAPGIPHALYGGGRFGNVSDASRREGEVVCTWGTVIAYLAVIARSEATKQSIFLSCCAMVCFASLAMTARLFEN